MLLHSDERLLEAVIADLEQQVMPALGEEHRFRLRLDINALKIVLRSLLQGRAATSPTDRSTADAALALSIRNGERAVDDPVTLELLESGLRERLSIHNPKWLG